LVWPCTLDDFQRPRFTGLTIMPQSRPGDKAYGHATC